MTLLRLPCTLPDCGCGEHRPACCFMQPADAGFRCCLLCARAQVPRHKRAALAGIEKDECLLRLDAVRKPILQLVLADRPLLKGTRAALIVLRDQIETSILRGAM